MLVDANVLLYARNQDSPAHSSVRGWLENSIGGDERVGLPWQSLLSFLRVATHPKVFSTPLDIGEAWHQIEQWIEHPNVWVPIHTPQHGSALRKLCEKYRVSGPIISDVELVALAVEHGLSVCSTDGDFARFDEIRWVNPLKEKAD